MTSNRVERILIVGGGFSGMAAAIELRKSGASVDLVEIDATWRSYGAGISLGGATLRVFRRLGILDEFLKRGSAADGAHIHLANGTRVATLPTPRLAGDDVPGGGAIMRPELAAILANATRASGARVLLGHSFRAMTEVDGGVEVALTNGETSRYDLVIGADGIFSKVRAEIFPDAPKPAYTGQVVWRAVVDRAPEIETAMMWMGPGVKVGVNPVSKTKAYMFLTEDQPQKRRLDDAELVATYKRLLAPFSDPVIVRIREALDETSQIVARPLEALLLQRPWYKGRIVLTGDAVHATTPHLASGACIGLEDSVVLADELAKAQTVEAGLEAYQSRRWERCRMVVENSVRLGEIEIANGDKQEHSDIMRRSMMALAAPI